MAVEKGKLEKVKLVTEEKVDVAVETTAKHLLYVKVKKEAVKKVDEGIKRKKIKNVSDDIMDGTVGKIWLQPQDIDTVPLKKPKGKKMRPVDEN